MRRATKALVGCGSSTVAARRRRVRRALAGPLRGERAGPAPAVRPRDRGAAAATLTARLRAPAGRAVSALRRGPAERALPPLHARRETCWRACRARAGWCASSRTATATAAPTGAHEVAGGPQPPARPRPPRRLAVRGGDRRGRPHPLRPRDGRDLGRLRAGRHRPARRAATTGRAPCASARTAGCTSRSARAATCAVEEDRAARRDPALPAGRLGRGGLRDAACATPSASTGGPRTASSTRPTTAATCSATTSRPASSTASCRAASTAGRSRTATACPTRTSARGRRRASRRRSRPSTASAPTTRRSA